MHRIRRSLLLPAMLALCVPLCILEARAQPTVRVVATDPGVEATLGRDEPFYLRIEFATDQPISIWARPYFQGKPVSRTKTNPSGQYSGPSVAGMLLGQAFMLGALALLVGGLVAPAWGLWKWRELWRAASALPALAMAFVILRIIVDVSRDPTSHNLWPFEIVIVGFVSLAAMGVLALVRRLTAPESGPPRGGRLPDSPSAAAGRRFSRPCATGRLELSGAGPRPILYGARKSLAGSPQIRCCGMRGNGIFLRKERA